MRGVWRNNMSNELVSIKKILMDIDVKINHLEDITAE